MTKQCRRLLTNSRQIIPAVLIAQTRLAVLHWNLPAADEDLLHVSLHIEGIAVRNHYVCGLANIEGTKLIGDSPDLCRIDGQCLERFFIWQSIRNSISRRIGEIAIVFDAIRSKRNLHASLGEFAGKRIHAVIPLVGLWRIVDRTDNHRHLPRGDFIEDLL